MQRHTESRDESGPARPHVDPGAVSSTAGRHGAQAGNRRPAAAPGCCGGELASGEQQRPSSCSKHTAGVRTSCSTMIRIHQCPHYSQTNIKNGDTAEWTGLQQSLCQPIPDCDLIPRRSETLSGVRQASNQAGTDVYHSWGPHYSNSRPRQQRTSPCTIAPFHHSLG